MPHQLRADYEAVVANPDGRFALERPPLFSPAAAVQDEGNGKGSLHQWAAMFLPSEYTNWADESQAHVRSCYLGDWSALAKVRVSGPEALAFLSWLGMNDLSSFAHGQIKHHVQLDENGWVASEGVICRLDDGAFLYTAGSSEWLEWQFSQRGWDAEVVDVNPDEFIFGVQGPNALATMEAVAGESLRDIAFNHSRPARIGETDVRILRTGISGELGYEIHGPAPAGNAIWAAITAAGEAHGLLQLGGRAQSVQHIEAGIATNGLDYFPSAAMTPGAPKLFRRRAVGGSFIPANGFTDYFRTPFELGWGRPDRIAGHEFLGRDALIAAGPPARTLMGLIWNADDVREVLTAGLRDGDVPEQMDLPRRLSPAFDQVLAGGKPVGVSTGRVLSLTLRAMISLVVIDRDHATPGTPVTVTWGRPGTAQRTIRAEVVALPFKPDHRRVDVTTL